MLQVTDETLDAVLEARRDLQADPLARVSIFAPARWDRREDGLYVVGLHGSAFVHCDGTIEWLP